MGEKEPPAGSEEEKLRTGWGLRVEERSGAQSGPEGDRRRSGRRRWKALQRAWERSGRGRGRGRAGGVACRCPAPPGRAALRNEDGRARRGNRGVTRSRGGRRSGTVTLRATATRTTRTERAGCAHGHAPDPRAAGGRRGTGARRRMHRARRAAPRGRPRSSGPGP